MGRGRLLAAGYLGAAWGALTLLSYLLAFVYAAAKPADAWAVQITAALGLLAFAGAMLSLSPLLAHPAGKFACAAAAALAFAALVTDFLPLRSYAFHVAVAVLLGLSMIVVGGLGILQAGPGPWRLFAGLLVLAGALKAIVIIGDIIHPFIACAAGTVLFVAMRVAANRAA